MDLFTIVNGERSETFRPQVDFAEGYDHLHWTLSGIEKLIKLGLWKREYSLRGALKTKPPRVERLQALASRPCERSKCLTATRPDR
jgi:hypothetical protein